MISASFTNMEHLKWHHMSRNISADADGQPKVLMSDFNVFVWSCKRTLMYFIKNTLQTHKSKRCDKQTAVDNVVYDLSEVNL